MLCQGDDTEVNIDQTAQSQTKQQVELWSSRTEGFLNVVDSLLGDIRMMMSDMQNDQWHLDTKMISGTNTASQWRRNKH